MTDRVGFGWVLDAFVDLWVAFSFVIAYFSGNHAQEVYREQHLVYAFLSISLYNTLSLCA
jgi:hypothetical protein